MISVFSENYIYKHFRNEIHVAVPNHSCQELILSTDNGILEGNNCEYKIIPMNIGTCTVTVKTLKHGAKIKLGEVKFRVRYLDHPYADLCGHRSQVKKDELLTCSQLFLTLYSNGSALDYKPPYKIFEFDLLINHGLRFSSKDNQLTQEMKDALTNIMSGDILEFENIKAYWLESAPTPNEVVDIDEFKITIE